MNLKKMSSLRIGSLKIGAVTSALVLALGLALICTTAGAYTAPGTGLALDKLNTCQTASQKAAANQAITFLENFRWWKIKNLVTSLHDDYVSWHASRVYLATLYPSNVVDSLPYKNGLVTKDRFLNDLAMIAYTNDVPKYTIEATRLECVGEDTAVISSLFNGMNVYRDKTGKALYQTPITNVPVRFMLQVKDGKIYRDIIDLEDTASKDMIDRLGALIKAGVPNVEEGTIPDQKYDDILADFVKQAGK